MITRFGVIDCEGTSFKLNNKQSLIISEISIVIFDKNKLIDALSYRLNYNLTGIQQEPYFKQLFKYLNKHFPNVYNNKLIVTNQLNPDIARDKVLNMINNYNINDNIFAKGYRQESIWLYHPNCCDGNFDTIPKCIYKLNELSDYNIPKYDDIDNNIKSIIIRNYNSFSSFFNLFVRPFTTWS